MVLYWLHPAFFLFFLRPSFKNQEDSRNECVPSCPLTDIARSGSPTGDSWQEIAAIRIILPLSQLTSEQMTTAPHNHKPSFLRCFPWAHLSCTCVGTKQEIPANNKCLLAINSQGVSFSQLQCILGRTWTGVLWWIRGRLTTFTIQRHDTPEQGASTRGMTAHKLN